MCVSSDTFPNVIKCGIMTLRIDTCGDGIMFGTHPSWFWIQMIEYSDTIVLLQLFQLFVSVRYVVLLSSIPMIIFSSSGRMAYTLCTDPCGS